jgi:hypothetical protein
MGWWEIADGAGVVGDRPADILGELVDSSFGERLDTDLLAGLLVAFGAALLRNPAELVSDPPGNGAVIVAELQGRAPIVVAIKPVEHPGSLHDSVYDALEAVSFQYRESGPERMPTLLELLATLAFPLRSRIVDPDSGEPVELLRIRPQVPPHALRLDQPDWRARMAALAYTGRMGVEGLAQQAQEIEIPPLSVGLRDVDRRALLALRDAAVARMRGETLERPVHPDPDVAAARARLLADVAAAVEGTALPAPDSPAYVLHALLDPGAVRGSGTIPPEWQAWLRS